ncbi:hypothetical protein AL755_03795 (plasmid) [Arthrobacter sp. ERGS1:01]|uniref:hypothetical protein n=1 Tax=Arthrobacter sp. ERGS1:01 TaxID=1704044 RepID=UPI0006B54CFD|nr:hypothetical protein [Arthrobacter sp. ERGS1:01]ALE04812.1 hypothetical protein AL755_03795 [Arthrobacter sp. ERGS1:01]
MFWFNGDDSEHHAGAKRGHWSGGLHIPTPEKVDAVRISQVPFGPDFLEVLTRSGGTLHRWYWTPEQGFLDGGHLGQGTMTDPAPLVHTEDALHTVVCSRNGTITHLASEVTRYPELSWRPLAALDTADNVTSLDLAPDPDEPGALVAAVVAGGRLRLYQYDGRAWRGLGGPGGQWHTAKVIVRDGAIHLVGLEASRAVRMLTTVDGGLTWTGGPVLPDGRCESASAAWSSLSGGCIEIITRSGTQLRHHRWNPVDGSLAQVVPDPICSTVWLQSTDTPVHRYAAAPAEPPH